MADERMIPLFKSGQPVEMAMTPKDFFSKKTMPKHAAGDAVEMVTAADAGYSLGDRYEDLTEYDGPKTKRQQERATEARRSERAAPKAEPVSARADAAKPDEAKKPD